MDYLDNETFEICNADDHWSGMYFETSGDSVLGYNIGLVHFQLNGLPFNVLYILFFIGQTAVPKNYNLLFRNQQCLSYKVTVWGDGVPSKAMYLVQNKVYHPEELEFDLVSNGLEDGRNIEVYGDVMTTSPQGGGGTLYIKIDVTAKFEIYYIKTFLGIPVGSGSFGYYTHSYSRTESMSATWVPDLP
ncbi:MAG: hypothetical protein ACFFDW_07705 [Candidatus Thorarchaeota archaeon]